MKDSISQDLNFPSLPDILTKCLAELYTAEPNFDYMVQLIQQDVALVSSILKLANSASYANGQSISELKVGMIRIGLKTVIQILLVQTIEHIFPFKPIDFFNLRALLDHCKKVSQISFEIGKLVQVSNLPDLLIAGLLHDIGLIAMAYLNSEIIKNIIEKCVKEKCDFVTAEHMLNLEGHNILGAKILKKWNLTNEVILLVNYHHTDESQWPNNLTLQQNKNLNILNLADTMAHRFIPSFDSYQIKTHVNKVNLEKIGINTLDIEHIVQNVKS